MTIPPPVYKNFWRRVGALLVDFSILYSFVYGLSMVIPLPEAPVNEATQLWASTWAHETSLYGIALSVVGMSYDTVMVKYFQGTLGKLLFRIKVTTVAGGPLTWGRSFARTAVHFAHTFLAGLLVDFVVERTGVLKTLLALEQAAPSLTPDEGLVGSLAVFAFAALTVLVIYTGDWISVFSRKHQTLHDMISGTVVVRR